MAVSGAALVAYSAGTALVLLVIADVFLTVLFPASGRGPVRRPLSRWTWRCFAVLGRRMASPRRRQFLAYSGPVQIAVTIVVWVSLLVFGWALVFQPALGAGIDAAQGPTSKSFATALYYSGFSITTLGTGDVVPTTGAYRLLTVLEAGLGFSVFTMVLTYFLSIYSALVSRKSFAASLHHRTFGSGLPVQLLVGLADDGELSGARHELSKFAEFLTHTSETHRSYPVLRYFHFRHHRYALPRLLLIALDGAALVRCCLDADRYRGLIRSSGTYQLAAAGLETLEELVPRAHPEPADAAAADQWCGRFRHCVDVLRTAGVTVVQDVDRGAAEYVALRERWDAPLRALSDEMLYDWEEIDVMQP
ncbi:Ion channel [Pedococcus cremeus]|uniref:Ion channel n=1 Tax=Pedococcus cremeus TaxID=587636 RepID=A0A1H9XPM7_9MICO|nr:potassium channel family protein [Pedococcus cremeus]SES48110.1 Ion channel [Pedococcus cremeus]